LLQPNAVRLSQLYATNKYRSFRAIVRNLSFVTGGIGVVMIASTALIGVVALRLVFGVDFSHYHLALLVIVAGGVVNALVSIYINVLIIARQFRQQFYVLLATNLALAGVSGMVVKQHGLLGAVLLYTIANVLQLSVLFVVYRAVTQPTPSAIR
jgi:O-antigen/teichoic acid export membrane protein